MRTSLLQYENNQWNLHTVHNNCDAANAQLVLCFASREILSGTNIYNVVREKFPLAHIAFSSTSGEIYNDRVVDNSFVAAALSFDKTKVVAASVNINAFENSYDAALALINKIPQQDLNAVLVLSDGSMVNGSELVKGFNSVVNREVVITGGLAGDGTNFFATLVGLNEQPSSGNIVAIGFYGQHITVTHGSNGGWQTFGLEKEVTRSSGNKLFEVDNKNALDVYKKYLGPEADHLPGSALMFPLSVLIPGGEQPVVRTILSIDNDDNSMTFAGDIPEGSKVRFMKASLDMLTSAAAVAAQNTMQHQNSSPVFSLLVSCVGRKIVLGLRTEEEVEAVLESFDDKKTAVAGFYSYGEIAPFNSGGDCQLHNQTMTITSFYELS